MSWSSDYPVGVYSFFVSGRLYISRTTWHGWLYNYGPSDSRWTQNLGTGSSPAYSTSSAKGFLVPKKGQLLSAKLLVQRSVSTSEDIILSVDIVRGGTIIPVGTIVSQNYNTANSIYQIESTMQVEENDIIVMAGKKDTGDNTEMYLSTCLTITLL